mgnify:CR=1 FL=1
MGRGLGKNNMSEGELKEAKARRDKKFYEAHQAENKKKRALAIYNAKTITCGCGGTYKDVIQNKNSHERTQRHSLWDEEERTQVRELICKKVNKVNTIEEAQLKLNEVYFNKERYTLAQKEGYIPTLVNRLNKMADKVVEPPPPPPTPPPPPPPPPPPKPKKLKLKIKRKLNIISD